MGYFKFGILFQKDLSASCQILKKILLSSHISHLLHLHFSFWRNIANRSPVHAGSSLNCRIHICQERKKSSNFHLSVMSQPSSVPSASTFKKFLKWKISPPPTTVKGGTLTKKFLLLSARSQLCYFECCCSFAQMLLAYFITPHTLPRGSKCAVALSTFNFGPAMIAATASN